jgi:hypothetical protein
MYYGKRKLRVSQPAQWYQADSYTDSRGSRSYAVFLSFPSAGICGALTCMKTLR